MKSKVSALALCLTLLLTFCSVSIVRAAGMTSSAGGVGGAGGIT